jgi:hypothetical protein
MSAIETIKAGLGLSNAEMRDWVTLFREELSRLKPSDDRVLRLSAIRNDADRYFFAEMGRLKKGMAPFSGSQLDALVDAFFEELGVTDMPPRWQPPGQQQ